MTSVNVSLYVLGKIELVIKATADLNFIIVILTKLPSRTVLNYCRVPVTSRVG